MYRLPGACEGGGDLAHPGVETARVGVDFAEQLDLGLEGRFAERVDIAIEAAVGARGRRRHDPAVARVHRPNGFGGALDRGLGKLAGVGVAGRLARDRAQAETLGGVEAGAFQAAIVEAQTLGLTVLEEQLAVVGAGQRFVDQFLAARPVEPGTVEEQLLGGGDLGHGGFLCASFVSGAPLMAGAAGAGAAGERSGGDPSHMGRDA